MPTAVKSWKFLKLHNGKIASAYGLQGYASSRLTVWEVGEWKHQPGIIRPCYSGFHHSSNPYDALTYVAGDVLARVEVKGTRVSDWEDGDDSHKEAVSDMRIVRAGLWGKADSAGLALHVAKLAAARLQPGSDVAKLAERGLGAAREWLRSGQEVDRMLLNAFAFSDIHAISAVYNALQATRVNTIPGHAGGIATFAVGNAAIAVDGGWSSGGKVWAAANEWMENRFKTLPRF